MRSEYHYRWFASVYPNSLHIYQREIEGRKGNSGGYTYLSNFESNDTEGTISRKAAKRIERGLTWILYYAKPKKIYDAILQKSFSFKINFITLTLPAPQCHSDDEVKKVCLNNFLDICRKTHQLKNYVWKAEAQINGNIHFHLVTDCYIRFDKIQAAWNSSVNLLKAPADHPEAGLSYIDRFEKKIGHRHPNSTDVHSVKHVKRIASYVSKYMSKNRAFACIGDLRIIDGKTVEVLYGSDQYRQEEANQKRGKVVGHVIAGPIRKIEGRLWFLSRSLSQCEAVRINEDEHQFQDLSTIIQKGNLHQFNSDFCFNYYGDVSATASRYAPWLADMMKKNRELSQELKRSKKEFQRQQKEAAKNAAAAPPLPSSQKSKGGIQASCDIFS